MSEHEMSEPEMSEPEMNEHETLVAAVNEYAIEHYEDGGWDVLVECWTSEEYLRFWQEGESEFGNPMPKTAEEAIDSMRDLVSVWDDRQADARNSAF